MVAATHYLDLIDQGVSAWNRWRSQHPDEYPDLESAYLFEKSLRGINFSNTNLSRACLIGSDLHGADLSGANMSGAYANNTNFGAAKLTAADLRGGNFIEANFSEADVSDAVIEGADFTDASWPETLPIKLVGPATAPQTRSTPNVSVPETARSRWQWPLAVGGVAISIAVLSSYLVVRARATNFVSADGTVKIQLVCHQLDLVDFKRNVPDHIYQNGTEFYGKFGEGQPANGRGSMLYTNGNRYDGEYRSGKRNGCGTFSFQNGRRYMGEFSDDLFSGRGIWMLENGDRYIGDFAYNKCDGEGVYLFADGTSQSGLWQQGRLVGGELTCDRNPTELPKS